MTRWPRLVEIVLGLWLIASPWVFGASGATGISEAILGAAVALLAAASLSEGWERLHWLELPIAIWVILLPYSSFARPGPPLAQNDILTGLLLLMMIVLPTRALEPPERWRRR